jgi:hypothetical protein
MDQAWWLLRFQRQADAARPGAITVILEEGHELNGDALEQAPTAARRLLSAAQATGWRTRCIRTVAAVPTRGLVVCITVRCARHDERVWSSWWNGRFDSAQYVRAGLAIERLGADRLPETLIGGQVPIASLTVPKLRELAKTAQLKIPVKAIKIDIARLLVEAGVTVGEAATPRRGVLDAVEGRGIGL